MATAAKRVDMRRVEQALAKREVKESCKRCGSTDPCGCDPTDPDEYDHACLHINGREISGGFLECDECGRMVPA
jgi:hypothetical protein